MRRHILILLAGLCVPLAAAARSRLPTAPKHSVEDRYWGVSVSEDYRWLEDASSEETKLWTKAQHERTVSYLSSLPTYDETRRRVEEVLDTPGEDHSPAWSNDGKKLAFLSDRSGTPNIYLFDTADGSITQLTDVQGGVTSLSWSRAGDRLVFSAFDRGGFDVFAVREALSLDPAATIIHYPLAMAYRGAGDRVKAQAHLVQRRQHPTHLLVGKDDVGVILRQL